MSIQPLATRYRGYRMRSRTEARWCVFFDGLGIPYEYEKEGYNLAGTWYLPDFWLPELSCWIEIKGKPPTRAEEEKASLLAQATHARVYLFWGDVAQETCEAGCEDGGYVYRPWFKKEVGWCDGHQLWCQCPNCGLVGIAFQGRSDRLSCKQCYYCTHILRGVKVTERLGTRPLSQCPTHGKKFALSGCPRMGKYLDEGYNTNTLRIQEARAQARSARFEHDETPQVR